MTRTAAHRFLRRLRQNGIDYLLVNAGTDFPPLIEAYAAAHGADMPRVIAVPHENVATAMAAGYAQATGRPLAVMVHVSVGLANATIGIMNASRARLPMIVAGGRTPWFEKGRKGARSRSIHWAQEMFDQGGMVREHTKWDYELRGVEQVEEVVDRTVAIAQSDPMGPVYLSLPREVLAEASPDPEPPFPTLAPVKLAAPPAADVEAAAARLVAAARPLIIATDCGRQPAETAALGELAQTHAIPVVCASPRFLALADDHPAHAGYDPEALVGDADAILVIDSDAPWIPSLQQPAANAWIAHLGPDPLFEDYPVRGFPCHLPLKGSVLAGLTAIKSAMDAAAVPPSPARQARLAALNAKKRALDDAARAPTGASGLSRSEATAAVVDAVGEDAVILSELGAVASQLRRTRPGTLIQPSPAGGLGWCTGAALGIKLARADALVVATMGDGSYMFGNPTPAHHVSKSENLPVLYVVFDNAGWFAVDRATRAMYPDGAAVRTNERSFSGFAAPPDYTLVAQASGAFTATATTPAEALDAVRAAAETVRSEQRQALVRLIFSD